MAAEGSRGMKLYAVLWEDRHVDPSVHLFTDREVAIQWAREQAESRRHDGFKQDWTPTGNDPQWLAYFGYSCEGDGLRVAEVEVDKELEPV